MTNKEISDTVAAVEANRADGRDAELKAGDMTRPSAEREAWAARADDLRDGVRALLDTLRSVGRTDD